MQFNGTPVLDRDPVVAVPQHAPAPAGERVARVQVFGRVTFTQEEVVAFLAGFSLINQEFADLSKAAEVLTPELMREELADTLAEYGRQGVLRAVEDLPGLEFSGHDDDREWVQWWRTQVATHLFGSAVAR